MYPTPSGHSQFNHSSSPSHGHSATPHHSSTSPRPGHRKTPQPQHAAAMTESEWKDSLIRDLGAPWPGTFFPDVGAPNGYDPSTFFQPPPAPSSASSYAHMMQQHHGAHCGRNQGGSAEPPVITQSKPKGPPPLDPNRLLLFQPLQTLSEDSWAFYEKHEALDKDIARRKKRAEAEEAAAEREAVRMREEKKKEGRGRYDYDHYHRTGDSAGRHSNSDTRYAGGWAP
ncbi:hypothetical protein PQX77_001834 [Marasmius sp. AFHP31]|nr:hypothetical protein PQX77_001834 [Marasmius sp. AFHP31]